MFGAINSNEGTGTPFAGTIDGNGYAIKNAVIPFGTAINGTTYGSGNFIGTLTGTLKNIAFLNCNTQNVADFNAAHPDVGYGGTVDGAQCLGIVGYLNGKIDNVYAEVELRTGTLGELSAGGVLAAYVNAGASMKNCVTNVTADDYGIWESGVVGCFTAGVYNWGMLSDCGLIAGKNNGTMINCFAIVEQTGWKTAGSTDVNQWLPMMYGSFRSAWNDGPSYNVGTGAWNNVARYDSILAFKSAHESSFAGYGFNSCWNTWLA